MAKETKRRFDPEANKVYTYPDIETLLENTKDLADFVNHHQSNQVPRLSELDDYYLGYNRTILQRKRRKEEHMADHRAAHNHARYVSQFVVGYLTGNPIKVTHEDENVQQIVKELNDTNEADALNSELTLDCSVYGRAYELVFRDQNDQNRFILLSPLDTFIIHDDTVEQKPIAGVRYRTQQVADESRLIVELYTPNRINTYHAASDTAEYSLEKEEKHYFGGVPIIEYQNNRFRQGDYENVLDLIDLYDAAQSDTANYMTDLNDAMLKIIGDVELGTDEAKEMKESNIIFLKPGTDQDGKEQNVEADYIYKQYDVSGSEAYKTRIESDIHKFTNTPDMNDENFAGQQTGEAMKYKLFGLEQIRATKERYFKRSMRNRYRLINNVSATGSELPAGALENIMIEFTPNFPKNTKEQVDIFNSLGGEVSNETKLEQYPFEVDIEEEQKRLAAERERTRQASSYMDVES
ncbi:phage portal protein [Lentibacillus kapialis]|uniref:Phage portal protein n=1 Tax=Lentibacillus kapialis TaxID=340214 RepID=A0A917PP97_9BACI|nr:phage portal protein [Lentibacillus kapialis]GGJ86033.1 phage portal protein [Lentibacillus kapialis]